MVDWIEMKFCEHVYIILMHLPIKHLGQWMHEYGEKLKIIGGDCGQFLKKCALEFTEIP